MSSLQKEGVEEARGRGFLWREELDCCGISPSPHLRKPVRWGGGRGGGFLPPVNPKERDLKGTVWRLHRGPV